MESNIKDIVAKKRLFEAEKLLSELNVIYPESIALKNEGKYVTETLAKLRRNLTRLNSCPSQQEKIDLCEEIIETAVDCYEAKTALEKFPPLPPQSLVIKELPTGFQLHWTAPQTKRSPNYVIVRKQGGVPSSSQDGVQLAENLTQTTYTDSSCVIGAIYGYAVFSQRGEQIENVGSKTGLLQIVGEIRNLQTSPDNSSVAISWTPIPTATIKITRYQGDAPSGTGKEIYPQNPGRLRDTGLINGQVYTYKFQTIFQSPEGKDVVMPGKIISCKPTIPPPDVFDLKAEMLPNDNIRFQGTQPKRGTVYLFVNKTSPAKGTIMQAGLAELIQQFGQPISSAEHGTTRWHNTETGFRFIVPVTLQDGIAVFGQSILTSKIEEIRNLRLHNSGTHWYLRWDFPEGIDQVLLAYRNDQMPDGKNDTNAIRRIVTRKEYKKNDAVSFAGNQNYYFIAFSLIERDGKRHVSHGIRRQTMKVLVKYSLNFRKSTNGDMEGILEIQAKNADSLPAFIVRKNEEHIPLHRNEGVQIASISPSLKKRGSLLIAKTHLEIVFK
ncbi:MAG: hypothetical protein LBT05_06895 [Planctomycetaceae bacterium]|jgi:hypothetical protein|nr:hypothetical protein [Planctomycetaceae bacterium]